MADLGMRREGRNLRSLSSNGREVSSLEGINSSDDDSVSGNGAAVREKYSVTLGDQIIMTLLLIRMNMNSVVTRILLLR
jgi:hypothetical protein